MPPVPGPEAAPPAVVETANPRVALVGVDLPPAPVVDPAAAARAEEERRRELAHLERVAGRTRLDAAPAPKQPLRFRYPRELSDQKVAGSLELLVRLGATGDVQDVRVLRSSGSEALDAAAADAVRHSSYRPPRRDGRPVEAWIRQPVQGMCCRPETP